MMFKRIPLALASVLALMASASAIAESGIPAGDLLLWPKSPVPAEAFTPVPEQPTAQPEPATPMDPELLQADLQSELWKDIPVIAPEPVTPVAPPEPTGFQQWLRREPKFFLGIGMFADQLGRFATQPSGGSSFSSSSYFSVLGSVVLEIPPFWKLAFWALDTPIRKTDPDGGVGSSYLVAGVRALRVFRLAEGWTVEPLLGLGLMLYQVSGSGGTVQLNNGNGFTTFGFPSDSSTAHLFFLEAGAAITIWRFRLENSIIATGIATSRRSFSFLSSLTFGVF